jgi:hypothetical protein
MPKVRLIDANAFSEQYGNYYAEQGPAEGFIGTVGDLIDKQPTIEGEPVRHGRWIPTEYDGYADGYPVYDAFECSECGHEHNGEEDTLTAFCPDCGAKMDGGSENG